MGALQSRAVQDYGHHDVVQRAVESGTLDDVSGAVFEKYSRLIGGAKDLTGFKPPTDGPFADPTKNWLPSVGIELANVIRTRLKNAGLSADGSGDHIFQAGAARILSGQVPSGPDGARVLVAGDTLPPHMEMKQHTLVERTRSDDISITGGTEEWTLKGDSFVERQYIDKGMQVKETWAPSYDSAGKSITYDNALPSDTVFGAMASAFGMNTQKTRNLFHVTDQKHLLDGSAQTYVLPDPVSYNYARYKGKSGDVDPHTTKEKGRAEATATARAMNVRNVELLGKDMADKPRFSSYGTIVVDLRPTFPKVSEDAWWSGQRTERPVRQYESGRDAVPRREQDGRKEFDGTAAVAARPHEGGPKSKRDISDTLNLPQGQDGLRAGQHAVAVGRRGNTSGKTTRYKAVPNTRRNARDRHVTGGTGS